MGRRITIELTEAESVALDLMRADFEVAEPGARWDRDALVHSILETMLDLHLRLCRERPLQG